MPVMVKLAVEGPLPKIVESSTRGPIRFAVRLEGDKKLSGSRIADLSLAMVEGLNQRRKEGRWVNDARTEDWVFVFANRRNKWSVSLRPDRKNYDQRFDYRKALLPAASQPTVAALLTRLAGKLTSGAHVLDPFCGSGLELIEYAKTNRGMMLFGGDLSETALQAARSNAAAGGVDFEKLECCDFKNWQLPRLDLIITNPPFGRRSPLKDTNALLEEFLVWAKAALTRGGTLAWISPQPKKSIAKAEELGFLIGRRIPIDLGGMAVEAQVLEIRIPRRRTILKN
jgi:tRNA G10  N-methylase Trm11